MKLRRIRYAVTGALAGIANGLFGAGGGLFLVPLLAGWCGMKERKAFATSVAVVVLLSPISLAVFWLRGQLKLAAAVPYLVGGAIGGLISGAIFGRVSVPLLRRLFGALLLYGGIRAVLGL